MAATEVMVESARRQAAEAEFLASAYPEAVTSASAAALTAIVERCDADGDTASAAAALAAASDAADEVWFKVPLRASLDGGGGDDGCDAGSGVAATLLLTMPRGYPATSISCAITNETGLTRAAREALTAALTREAAAAAEADEEAVFTVVQTAEAFLRATSHPSALAQPRATMATKDSGGAQEEQEHEEDEDGRQDGKEEQTEANRSRGGQEGAAAEGMVMLTPSPPPPPPPLPRRNRRLHRERHN